MVKFKYKQLREGICLKKDFIVKLNLILVMLSLGLPIYVSSMEKAWIAHKPLTSAEIIEKLLEKKSREETQAPKLPGEEKSKFDSLNLFRELYPKYEAKLEEAKRLLTHEGAGGLNFVMNLDEMRKTIQERFRKMYKNGKILTHKKMDANKWHEVGDDLTRIWGADYLAKRFEQDNRSNMKVPEYIIVIDNPNIVQVKLGFTDSCYPLSKILNGRIYAQKIEGKPVGRTQDLVGYGYSDYSDPGNILQTKNDDYYVVDTELKSFFYKVGSYSAAFKNVLGGYGIYCEYFKNRFKLVNNIDSTAKIIQFSITQPIFRGR